MADKKISQLTAATTPLTGTEVLPIVQDGSTVKVSVNNLTDGKAMSALTVTTTIVGVGNATPASTGAGITFPATQNASNDVNTLDDYEEGNWTPALSASGATITPNSLTGAKYVKIGKLVFISGFLRTDSVSGGSGSVSLINLPFPVGADPSGTAGGSSGVLIYGQRNFAGDYPNSVQLNATLSYGTLFYQTASNGAFSVLDASDLATGAASNQFQFAGSYMTN